MSTYGSNFFRELITKINEAPSRMARIPDLSTGGSPAPKAPSRKVAPAPKGSASAVPSGLKAKYQAMLKSLKKPSADEGFFARNSRRTANAEILAKFAEKNDLPGMYDPETGNFVTFDEVENTDTGEFEKKVQVTTNSTMDAAKDLAGKGLLPDVVRQRFTDQFTDTKDIFGGDRPEYRKDLEDIFKADAASRAKAQPSAGAIKKGVDGAKTKGAPELPVTKAPDPDDVAGMGAVGDGGVSQKPASDPKADLARDVEKAAQDARDAQDGMGAVGDGNLSALKKFAKANKGGLRNDPDEVEAIKALQRQLGITADGKYGQQTRQAVRKFQEKNNLTVDGDAGPNTIKALTRPAVDAGDNVASEPKVGFVPPNPADDPMIKDLERKEKEAAKSKINRIPDIKAPKGTKSRRDRIPDIINMDVNESYGPDFFKNVKNILEDISKVSVMEVILEDIALIALDEGDAEIDAVTSAIRKLGGTGEGRQFFAQQGLDIDKMSDDDIIDKVIAPMGRGAYDLAGQAERMVDPAQLSKIKQAVDSPLTRAFMTPDAVAKIAPKGRYYSKGAQGINPAKIDLNIDANDIKTFLDVYDNLKGVFPKADAKVGSGNLRGALDQVYKRMRAPN